MSEEFTEQGRGWTWNAETRDLCFYFELDGAATDEEGNDSPAGLRIKMGNCMSPQSKEERDKRVKDWEDSGIHGYPTKAITPEEYAKYETDEYQ